ncbi:MAG: flagellar hook-basal body complex protein FliE [Acidimicrobiia bacterium]|nr:flagellar hook-basal body complex protein FliE [Acidimicrobiia bacterium]
MPDPISSISSQIPAIAPVKMPETGVSTSGGFASMLNEAIHRVENFRVDSEQKIDRFLSGEDEEVHKVVMAAQQAELSFELFLQAKNKVVQAYQEIMRMQV